MATTTEKPAPQEENTGVSDQPAPGLPAEILQLFSDNAEWMAREFTTPLKLAVGDQAPPFSLPNALGEPVALGDYLARGPVVLVFYRGGWCPFCNLALNAYQRALPEMKALGANLLAISPEKPDNSLNTKERNALAFEVLSDHENAVARQYVHVFEQTATVTAAVLGLGVDYLAVNDSAKAEVPVPGVFIIAQSGKIIFAKSEGGDYRTRVEAADILAALPAAKA